jgi:hypothetical protein
MTESAAPPGASQEPPGSGSSPAKNSFAAHPITWTVIAVLLVGSVICTLVVPIYASTTPMIGDWPFFYFYLLVYMPVVAVVVWVCYLLENRIRAHGDAGTGAANAEAGK